MCYSVPFRVRAFLGQRGLQRAGRFVHKGHGCYPHLTMLLCEYGFGNVVLLVRVCHFCFINPELVNTVSLVLVK
jgi:hypothetical protein